MVELKIHVVVAAAFIPMIVGMLWYSPVLFVKPWLKGMEWTPEMIAARMKRGMGTAYAVMFFASLVEATVLAIFIKQLGVVTFLRGAWIGGWIGLGFIATTSVASVFFEGRSSMVWFLGWAYNLVCLMLMGGVIAAWS